MPMHIILDTDIGTDVDDCLALALALASPELELAGITTVYGDVALRSRMALKLLRLWGDVAGRPVADIPVAMGASQPLLGKRPVYWAGHEGQGLLTPDDHALQPSATSAAELIVALAMGRPGQVTLVAIGPLTNVALALLREPRLAQALAGVTIMGGAVGGAGALHVPWTEHNFRSDPEAAHIVLSSGAALNIVPLDVTMQVRIRAEDVSAIEAVGDPFHLAIADQVRRYPRFGERGGWTYLHDPLAVATLIEPGLVSFQPLHALVETQGEHTAGKLLVRPPDQMTPATARVALGVEAVCAERFIMARLTR